MLERPEERGRGGEGVLLLLLRLLDVATEEEERGAPLLLGPSCCCWRRRRSRSRHHHLPREERRPGQHVHQRADEVRHGQPGAPAAPPGQGRGGERALCERDDGRPEVSPSPRRCHCRLALAPAPPLAEEQPGRDSDVGKVAEVEHEEAPLPPREADGAGRKRGEGKEQEGRGDEVRPRRGGECRGGEGDEAPEEGFIVFAGLFELLLENRLVDQDGGGRRRRGRGGGGSAVERGGVEGGGGRRRAVWFRPIVVAGFPPHCWIVFLWL